MIKTIPAKDIYICDVCKKEGRTRKMEAVFLIKRHALDMLGMPAANGDYKFDACDACHNEIVKVINDVTVKLRGEG